MTALERFIHYVQIHTASAEDTEATPTTERQFDLSRLLERELRELGMREVYLDEHAYVYAGLPATPGCEDRPAIGFIAHLDTVPDFSGENVKPRIIPDYDGGDVVLGTSGRVLSPELFPHLPSLKGKTLITTDGTTVLGADDKAGVAAIMRACERLIEETFPFQRMKCVGIHGSFWGTPKASLPRAMLFIRKVMFLARVRMVCMPSSSCAASPGILPCTLFPYWLEATGMPLMVKYLFSSSNVAESPPRLATTTDAPTFMLLSKGVL